MAMHGKKREMSIEGTLLSSIIVVLVVLLGKKFYD